MAKEIKTNVMRILEKNKIRYNHFEYDSSKVSGAEVANEMGQEPKRVFKTLVTVSKTKEHYVFMIPVEMELDLKKCAVAVGEKSVGMIPQKELLGLTGYIHGGCSPIGMKKQFKTVIDKTAKEYETIFFSGGKVGFQVEVNPTDLEKVVNISYQDITK